MNKYNAIIFDLDGTLLDTLEDLMDSVNYALTQMGYEPRTIDEIRQFVGNGVRRLVARSLPDGEDNPDFQETFAIFKDYYNQHNLVKTKPYEGIMPVLQTLNDQAIPMAIVTNKIQSAAEMLRVNVFDGLIPLAVGDGLVPARKPAPDGVLYAMDKLGISDGYNVVYIGDSEVDAATAANSGLDCILCQWGFRSRQELEQLDRVAIIKNPQEILSYIAIS